MHWRYRVAVCPPSRAPCFGRSGEAMQRSRSRSWRWGSLNPFTAVPHVTLVGSRGVQQLHAALLHTAKRCRRVLVGWGRAALHAGEDLIGPVARDVHAGPHEKLSQRAPAAYLRDELLECHVTEFGFELDGQFHP